MAYQFRREPLDGQAVDRLVNACESFDEKLVVWTLLDTGLRVGEFCSLRPEQVEWQYARIVVHGKGGPFGSQSKRRVVPMTPRVRKLLEIRFVTHRSVRMTPRTAQRIVKRVAERAAVTKPVTPHVLRHTFAVNCVKAGVSTASLKKLLGHDRLETTEIYLNISPEDALREFREKVVR